MSLPFLKWSRRSTRANLRSPARRRLNVERLEVRDVPAGTWTALTSTISGTDAQSMMLLSDGTVLIHGGNDSSPTNWFKLTPNASGSYINGTIASVASSPVGRLFFTSDTLTNGDVFVLGGEYNGPNTTNNDINTGEVYNPVANTWTAITNFPQSNFGDDPSEVLANGTVLGGYILGPQTYVWTPTPGTTAPGTWAATGTKLVPSVERSDEETWVKLPDGSILSYDVFNDAQNGISSSQRYIQSSGTWVSSGTVPVNLTSSDVGFELGPGLLLPPLNGATQGNVFLIGATSNTAIYTPPPAGSTATGSWVAGPTIPMNTVTAGGPFTQGADDAPAAELPNGHVLFLVDTNSPKDFTKPTQIFDYDPVANTVTQQTTSNTTMPPALVSSLNGHGAFLYYMLDLPNGDVLMSTSTSGTLWEYTPATPQLTASQPTISNIAFNSGLTYTLTGTQLNGVSEGANYGDDAEMASNYPIVRLTNGSNVFYARTFNWSNTGVQTGATPVTTQFTLPAGLPFATYSLSVIANGIASTPVSFIPPVYADTRWAGMSNGSAVTDVDPVLAGNQPGIVGTNAFGTVDAAIAAAPVGGIVIVNGNNGTGSGSFSESVAVTKQVSLFLQEGAVSFGSLGGNVAAATIKLNGITLTTGSDNTSTEYDGTITGTGGFAKTGMGTLTLTAANTYTGGTAIDGGILQIGNAAATGSIVGSVSNIGGTLAFDRSDPTFTFGGTISGSGAIINEDNATLTGIISGIETVSQQSGGVLMLSAANAFSGQTTVATGTLKLGNAGGLGAPSNTVQVNAGATLDLGGFTVLIGSLGLNGTLADTGGFFPTVTMSSTSEFALQLFSTSAYPVGTTFALSGASGGGVMLNADAPVISLTTGGFDFGGVNREISVGSGGQWNLADVPINNGGFNLTGGGTLSIQGVGPVTNTGPITVTAGILDLDKMAGVNAVGGAVTVAGGTFHMSASNQIPATAPITVNTGTFDLNDQTETIGPLAGSGGTVSLGTGTLTVNTSGLTSFSGTITGTGGLVLGGTGGLILTGTNTYGFTGGTTINGGTLLVGADNNLGDPNGPLVFGAGALQALAGFTTARPVTLNAGGGTINTGSFAVTVSAAIGGAGGLTKVGTGTLTLGGASGYTGPTAVNGGTLLVTGSVSASAVSVAAGATLAGAGTVGATTVDGTLAPGNNIGILTTGSLTLNSDGTFAESIDGPTAGTGYSQVVAGGTVNVTGAAFDPILGNGFVPAANSAPFDILVNDSGSPIVGNFAGLPEGAQVSLGGQNFTISYLGGGSGNDIVLTPAAAAPPTVATVQVGDGTAERSEVRSITVTFSGPVTFTGGDANAAAAFELTHVEDSTDINNLAAAVSTNLAGQTVVTLTFTTTGNAATEIDPVSAENPQNLSPAPLPSLADGRYTLTILSANVSGAGGALAGGGPGGNYVSPTDTLGGGAGELQLYRLFGDADGDGIVDNVDLGQLRSSFNANSTNSTYLAYLDADNSGVVDNVDVGQFRTRFNTNIFS